MSSDILDRACALLVADLEEPPSVDAIARSVGMSRCHFTRAFAMRFGLPPHRFLMRARVLHARTLLEGGAAVADATFACGFCDQSHLTRWFKKLFGSTPGRFACRIARRNSDAARLVTAVQERHPGRGYGHREKETP